MIADAEYMIDSLIYPSENATEISLRFQCYFNEITVKSQ